MSLKIGPVKTTSRRPLSAALSYRGFQAEPEAQALIELCRLGRGVRVVEGVLVGPGGLFPGLAPDG